MRRLGSSAGGLLLAAVVGAVVGAGLTGCGGPSTSKGAAGTAAVDRSSVLGTTTSAVIVPGPGATSSTAAAPTTSVTPVEPAATVPPKPPSGSGVYGRVTAGPTCPVERAANPCLPRPVAEAEVDARNGAGATVASAPADSSGTFALPLPPGTYTLVASSGAGMYPRCAPVTVAVPAGSAVRADIACDTGIR